MSDFDFDKSFSADFRKSRPAEAKPAQWERVLASLRQNEEKKRRKRLALLWLPYLLTAATLGLLLWNRKANERQLSGLQAQLGQLETALKVCGGKAVAPQNKSASETTVMANPPIAQHMTSRRGTMNNDVQIVDKVGFGGINEPKLSTALVLENESPAEATQFLFTENNGVEDEEKITEQPQTADTAIIAVQQILNGDLLKTHESALGKPTQQISNPAQSNTTILSDTGLARKTSPPNEHDKNNQPARLALGIIASSYLFKDNIIIGNGGFYGANLQLILKKGWRLEGSFAYGKLKFSGTTPWPSMPQPPSVDYQFSKMETRYPQFIASVGIHHYFREGKRFQPLLFLDWLGIQSRKQQIDFMYASQNALQPDVTVTQKFGSNTWSLNSFRLGTGLSYKILPWMEGRAQIGSKVDPFNDLYASRSFNRWRFFYQLGVMGHF